MKFLVAQTPDDSLCSIAAFAGGQTSFFEDYTSGSGPIFCINDEVKDQAKHCIDSIESRHSNKELANTIDVVASMKTRDNNNDLHKVIFLVTDGVIQDASKAEAYCKKYASSQSLFLISTKLKCDKTAVNGVTAAGMGQALFLSDDMES